MTGAAFQARVSLKEQATDPISHTPVKKRLPDQGVSRHLQNSMVDPGSLCYWAVRLLVMTATAVARLVCMTQPAVSRSVERGRRVAAEDGIVLEKIIKA